MIDGPTPQFSHFSIHTVNITLSERKLLNHIAVSRLASLQSSYWQCECNQENDPRGRFIFQGTILVASFYNYPVWKPLLDPTFSSFQCPLSPLDLTESIRERLRYAQTPVGVIVNMLSPGASFMILHFLNGSALPPLRSCHYSLYAYSPQTKIQWTMSVR